MSFSSEKMFVISVNYIVTLFLISLVTANNTTKSFNIKDKIDWSKWTTGEGYTVTNRNKISSSTVSSFRNQPITLDWSRWEENSESPPSYKPQVNEEVQKIIDLLRKTTIKTVSIRRKVQKENTKLPRKPKATEQNLIQKNDIKLKGSQSVLNKVKDEEQIAENKQTLFANIKEDIESIGNEIEELNNQVSNPDVGEFISNAKVIGGIDWSLWNKESTTGRLNIVPLSSSEKNEMKPTQIDKPILPSNQPVLLKPSSTNRTPSEALKEAEDNAVLSFFGWPWWAWLICAVITAILLGIVYITVFWNDFKDCVHGREIFCAVSRNDK